MQAVLDKTFVDRMKADLALVAQFYDNPAATLEEAGVSEEFARAILHRDGNALLAMGWNAEEMNVALSGGHTSSPFHCGS
ncbi:hypothetical protein G7Y31_11105 [Corynebacterium lizhenjunii]|uniref:Extradiol ring-cleavage dioxygenase LigAB LigA subunit domain-containing protein n=1 Tax=Corynebacterium lizhenjunii TaxID=2709394 RepID=A0A7T0KFC1_9CORY|nr:hypothetical protein [Corynebacterium lizhenjunii]QPK79029.1 hypothetical protein G7Y31_11105 [Corynebacterium lizhenjunii]